MSSDVTNAVHQDQPMSADHGRHDQLLIARFAAGDSFPGELAQAQTLLGGCAECAALAADIQLIAARTSNLAAPRRPRDFRLSASDAERLRGSTFERLMRRLAMPGRATLRPVAGAALAIGLTLAAVGALPNAGWLAPSGGAAPAPGAANFDTAATEAPATAKTSSVPALEPASPEAVAPPTQEPASPGVVAQATTPTGADKPVEVREGNGQPTDGPPVAPDQSPNTSGQPDQAAASLAPAEPSAEGLAEQTESPTTPAVGTDTSAPPTQATESGQPALVVLGGAVALLGAVLLLVIWIARRRYSDPLLR